MYNEFGRPFRANELDLRPEVTTADDLLSTGEWQLMDPTLSDVQPLIVDGIPLIQSSLGEELLEKDLARLPNRPSSQTVELSMYDSLIRGGSQLFTDDEMRKRFAAMGTQGLSDRILGATDLLHWVIDQMQSVGERRWFLNYGLNFIDRMWRPKKAALRKRLLELLDDKHPLLLPMINPTTPSDAEIGDGMRYLHLTIPEWAGLEGRNRSLVDDALRRVLKNDWGIHQVRKAHILRSAGKATDALRSAVAKKLKTAPVIKRDEAGNPSWHLIDAVKGVKGVLDGVLTSPTPVPPPPIAQPTPVTPLPPVLSPPPVAVKPAKPKKPAPPEPKPSPIPPVKAPAPPPVIKVPQPAPTPEPVVTVPTPPVVIQPPPVTKPKPPLVVPPFTGWRLDVYNILKDTAPYADFEFPLKNFWVITGNILAESGSFDTYEANPQAVNKNDGYYKPWSRYAASCGLFQIREPTAAHTLTKNKKRIGPFGATQIPEFPKEPATHKKEMIQALLQYPEQIYLGMVLLAICMDWITSYFVFDDSGRITTWLNKNDKKLAEYANSISSPATPAWGVLMRFYWGGSSKAGPRTLLKNGAAKKLIQSRWMPFTKHEYEWMASKGWAK
jgi:hypothetical protein